MKKELFKKIYGEIKKSKTIYLVRHIGPDPDAVASQIALRESIKLTFPSKNVFAIGTNAARFKYLGLLDKANSFDFDNDLVITLDVPDTARVDGLDVKKFKNVIKIDHHPFVEKYGKFEYIDDKNTSTCQIVLEMILNTKLRCNKFIAEDLFMGIVSDSNRFLFEYTNPFTFDLVSLIIRKYKLDIQELYKKMYMKPISEVRLLGYIQSNIKVTKNGFAYIELENDIIKSFNADAASASNMINDLNNINEILVWLFITKDEKKDLYKVNIRSRGPVINEIASKYNGGGHKYASGVRTKDRILLDNLIEELDEACMQYKKDNE